MKYTSEIINKHTHTHAHEKTLSTVEKKTEEKRRRRAEMNRKNETKRIFSSIWYYVVDRIHNSSDNCQPFSACVDMIHVDDRILDLVARVMKMCQTLLMVLLDRMTVVG